MQWLRWESNPWGQRSVLGLSWDVLALVVAVAALFIVAHVVYTALPKSRPPRASAPETDLLSGIPRTVLRHSIAARLFHWLVAATVLELIATGFLPIAGVNFPWVTAHWVGGMVLMVLLIYHMVETSVRGKLGFMWFGRVDLAELAQAARALFGRQAGERVRPGKWPLPNKLFHWGVAVSGLVVIVTGLLMTHRVTDLPYLERDPYFLAGMAKTIVYVLHDLFAILLVGLLLLHFYLAARPDRWWLTRSMFKGTVPRERYLEHYDPALWPGSGRAEPGGSPTGTYNAKKARGVVHS